MTKLEMVNAKSYISCAMLEHTCTADAMRIDLVSYMDRSAVHRARVTDDDHVHAYTLAQNKQIDACHLSPVYTIIPAGIYMYKPKHT
jgi:hypothetical protein